MDKSIGDDSIASEAKALVAQMADHIQQSGENGGWFSDSLYDSAWVSLVRSPIEGDHWRFPQCFEYVLRTQTPEGTWTSDDIQDGGDLILTSLACLLSLQEHKNEGHDIPDDLDSRLKNGKVSVKRLLESWDYLSAERIGVETLVPALLQLLHEAGLDLEVSRYEEMTNLRDKRMRKFNAEELYQSEQHKLLHGLDGLIGYVDFDKLAGQKRYGAMCCYPSSTAAYLMNCLTWDEEAEAYLDKVVQLGGGTGAVRYCFPSLTFDVTWPLAFFLHSGFTREDLGADKFDVIADYLEDVLRKNSGFSGFMSEVVLDGDSTAQVLLIMASLGRETQEQRWIDRFEAVEYFKCFTNERNVSISVNCNILNTLVHLPAPERYAIQIHKVAAFLCKEWCKTEAFVDKWHLSPHYPMMSLAKALAKIVRLVAANQITLPRELLDNRVPTVLAQLCARTLQHQQQHGGWADNHEITAYAILTLVALSPLPLLKASEQDVDAAISGGRAYLLRNRSRWTSHAYLWVGKTTYGSSTFAQSFSLCAMRAKVEPFEA